MEFTVGCFVRITKEFESAVDGDLSVYPNDIIKIENIVNEEWLRGSIADVKGIFPSVFCEKLNIIQVSSPFGVALFDHEPHQPDELYFTAGDQISQVENVNTEWYKGECHGKTGIFPTAFISLVNAKDSVEIEARSLPQKDEMEVKPERPRSLNPEIVNTLRRSGSAAEYPTVFSELQDENQTDFKSSLEVLADAAASRHSSKQQDRPPSLREAGGTNDDHKKTDRPETQPNERRKSKPSRPRSLMESLEVPIPAMRHSKQSGKPTRPKSLMATQEHPNVLVNKRRPKYNKNVNRPRSLMDINYSTSDGSDGAAGQEDTSAPIRPPTLDTATLASLRIRTRSIGKENTDQAPAEEPLPPVETPTRPKNRTSFEETETYRSSVSFEEPHNNTSHIPPEDDIFSKSNVDVDDLNEVDVPDWPESIWNKPEGPEVSQRTENSEYEEEVEYANDEEIQSVAQEYEPSPEDKKIAKQLAEKKRLLEKELESKQETEDLLAKQFGGKTVDSGNVKLLQSVLRAHKDRIADLSAAIDRLRNQVVVSPEVGVKLSGIEMRDQVLIELIDTEQIHVDQLSLCVKAFVEPLRANTANMMDIDTLFLNIESILVLSDKLLVMLRGQQTLMSHEQMIGRCFTFLEEELHAEYTFYLENHVHIMTLLKVYLADKTKAEILNQCLIKIREETSCWDLQSFLIRPVQRIMKYPLILRQMLESCPDHWVDRRCLVDALKIVDSIVVFANESKRKEELLQRYNVDETSGLPKVTLHGFKKKSRRFQTAVTHSLNITNSTVADISFESLSEQFSTLYMIVKTLRQESYAFTDLIKGVQEDMETLCKSIHDFYDDLETQKDVFLYHGAALKIAQSVTPRFIRDLEDGPLSTLSEVLECFANPQLLVDKRNSKILDYDNLSAQDINNTMRPNENIKIARGEFEALHIQLEQDLPVIIQEGGLVVEKCAYSVLALFCQYSQACYHVLQTALEAMSLDLEDPPESLYQYHLSRMEECCSTLLDICSFDHDVTQAIVRGGTMTSSKFYEDGDGPDEPDRDVVYSVDNWVMYNTPITLGDLSSEESSVESECSDEGNHLGEAAAGSLCVLLYDFYGNSDGMLDVCGGTLLFLLTAVKEEDIWCYVQSGQNKGYVPKSYLTLSECPEDPATLDVCVGEVAHINSQTIKRKAPPPPTRRSDPSDNRPAPAMTTRTISPKRAAPPPPARTLKRGSGEPEYLEAGNVVRNSPQSSDSDG